MRELFGIDHLKIAALLVLGLLLAKSYSNLLTVKFNLHIGNGNYTAGAVYFLVYGLVFRV